MNGGTRGPVNHPRSASPPIDPARLTDQQLAIHAQGLYARLDAGYAKCADAPDDVTRLRWETAWAGLLGQYERGVDELRRRGLGA